MDIFLLIHEKQEGPFTEDQVRQSLAEGLIPPDLPAWHEGLAEWVPVETLPHVVDGVVPEVKELTEPAAPEKPVGEPENPPPAPVLFTSESRNKRKSNVLKYLTRGLVIAGLVAVSWFGAARMHHNASPSATATSSNAEIADGGTTSTDNNSTSTSPEDAKAWVKQAIQSSSGYSVTSFANPLHATDVTTKTSYQDVSFEGDVLSLYVHESVNDDDKYYTVKIDLAAIRPDSFLYQEAPECDMKGFLATDPKVYYSIMFIPKGGKPAVYSPDNVDVKTFNIEVKDEELAKRIVKALNFLSKNTKSEPF